MVRKLTFFAVALGLLLALPVAECLAMSADPQSMKCCRHMPCNPANQAHDCCMHMVPAQAPSALPVVHVPLAAPLAVADLLSPTEEKRAQQITWSGIHPQQHSPPDLYVVSGALLI
jgi:hypothetical protein